MRTKTVPSRWIFRDKLRLDVGPYLSGAVETRVRLEELSVRKDRLSDLTVGGDEGIYHAGREGRVWVNDPKHGVPFMGSTDILKADLSSLKLISAKQVGQNPKFTVRAGWTLITRSGTIGRMAYARPDMDGLACSEHVMRVVPDSAKVPSGYLYAYLHSKFGLPLVISGTYGAIIQHIEPHHIANLPVPRLGKALEQQVHGLIEQAARARADASKYLSMAVKQLQQAAGVRQLPTRSGPTPFGVQIVCSSKLQERFDAFYHSRYRQTAIDELDANSHCRVGDLASSVAEPNRFKRTKVQDSTAALRFFGTAALMWNTPVPSYFVPKRQRYLDQYIVSRRTLLVPRSGQLSGVIGRVTMPYGAIIGGAVSEDAIRIHCPDENTAGFLFVALRSEVGLRQLKASAFGSSIPHLDVRQIAAVLVPDVGESKRQELGRIGVRVGELRDRAIALEKEAKSLVETAIEQAS